MPYSAEHKEKTRQKVIESARVLFNRHGFEDVTIDMVMTLAGLTRGGFYNHFESKEKLYAEAVSSFLTGRGARWRTEAGVDTNHPSAEMARNMIKSYLSPEHLGDLDAQCPMIALPSDVARAGPEVQSAYQELLEAMVRLFEQSLKQEHGQDAGHARRQALALSALCVGGMVLARTLPNSDLAEEVRAAANEAATAMAL